MEHITPIFVGFLAAFLGLLAPSMLNMTAARFSIEKGRTAGIQFASGASFVILIQSGIALFFAKYLLANPSILTKLKTAAIFVLLGLSVFFFLQTKKTRIMQSTRQRNRSYFVIGMAMSSLNMLAVPFFLAMATFASQKGWMQVKQPFSSYFAFGSALGSFSLFIVYVFFAIAISKRVHFIAKNINYILSALFIVLAVITAIQVIND